MIFNSKFAKGTKVTITSGRFEGFTGVVVDFFAATSKETKKIEFGVVVEDEAGEQKQAFDSRIKLQNDIHIKNVALIG